MLGYDGATALIHLPDGRRVESPVSVLQASYNPPSFSPDGTLFAASSDVGYARVWDASSLRELATVAGFMAGVHSLIFSPDNRRLATGSNGVEAVRLWDLESGEAVLTLEGEGSIFRFSQFSPDANVLGSMNMFGALHLWRAPSWEEIDAAKNRADPAGLP